MLPISVQSERREDQDIDGDQTMGDKREESKRRI